MHGGLVGKIVAVAGGSGGIGLAIVNALQAIGAHVSVLDRHPPAPNGLAPTPRDGRFRQCDLRDARSVDAAIEALATDHRRIDGLVNAAGVTRDRALHKMSDEEWQDVLDVNLSGAFYLLRAVAKFMRPQGSGSIINITSINGLRGKFGQANYSASKAGLIALTRTAARELGPKGIRVNAVAPGMVRTPMTAALPPHVTDEALRQTSLGRLAVPEDIAGPVLFLLSDWSRHVSGHVLVVDGGQTA